eukprot:11395917-Alexandrium_andersonii.AAC.1
MHQSSTRPEECRAARLRSWRARHRPAVSRVDGAAASCCECRAPQPASWPSATPCGRRAHGNKW